MLSRAQQTRLTAGTGATRPLKWRWGLITVIMLLVLTWVGPQHNTLLPARAAEDLNVQTLYQMVNHGEGAQALHGVIISAEQRGNWGPAPGDTITYDATIANNVRGKVLTIDLPPGECADPKLKRLTSECFDDFVTKQNLVRFGDTLFATPDLNGERIPRAAPDDVLSTYIEEVGHSWQEYLYETEGRGHGARTRVTSWEIGLSLKHGWEYQVKAYILNLDGTFLTLSEDEHLTLLRDICNPDSYAYPLGYDVPPYGPPLNWPNPQGWPTRTPSQRELDRFCSNSRST